MTTDQLTKLTYAYLAFQHTIANQCITRDTLYGALPLTSHINIKFYCVESTLMAHHVTTPKGHKQQ